MRFSRGLGIAFVMWMVAGSALAEDHPSLAAVAVDLSTSGSPTVPALQAAAGQAVFLSDRFVGRDLVDRLDPRGAAARRQAQSEAEETLQSAREAFDNLDLAKAIHLFADAVDVLRKTDPRTAFDDYIRARLWHAASRYLNGDKPGSQKEFTRIFVEAPHATLDKQLFPPDLMSAAERARAVVLADLSLSLTVSSSPPGVCWVDGKLAGPTPATVEELAPGEHSVVVAAPGYQLSSTTASAGQVAVSLKQATGFTDLESARGQIAAAFPNVDRSTRVASVARSLGVDQLLVVAVDEKQHGSLHLLRVAADGRPLAAAEGNAGADPVRELTRLLPAVLEKDAPPEVQRTLIANEKRTGESAQGIDLPRLAPWVGGGALALAAGSLIFGLVADHARNGYGQTPQTAIGTSAHLASLASTNAALADVFGIAAAVTAATAASFWFTPGLWGWHPRPSSEPAPEKDKPADEEPRTSFLLTPVVTPNGGGAMASVAF